jgi:DNA-binding transcriptional regulator LsrR (DeoR family)
MVTQEIAEELAVRRINIREELIKLLDQADLVKFADSRPNIEECSRSLQIAETLIASATEPETPLMVDG